MTKILDRYASAVHSSNLASKESTVWSDADVLGAAGLAGKRNALAMALSRLLYGDNTAAHDLVRVMAEMATGKAKVLRVQVSGVQATDIARAVLAWYRDGVCRTCCGLGFKLINGGLRKVKSNAHCDACHGTARLPFDSQFPLDRLALARWLRSEVERQQSKAGAVAMAKLAPRLDVAD